MGWAARWPDPVEWILMLCDSILLPGDAINDRWTDFTGDRRRVFSAVRASVRASPNYLHHLRTKVPSEGRHASLGIVVDPIYQDPTIVFMPKERDENMIRNLKEQGKLKTIIHGSKARQMDFVIRNSNTIEY
ncbi:hypothetical protein E2542_SST22069 [Spatholobus suberectus]|nr:hypothetical protein E2542_SST22069 [Spatholobus suberectus]